MSKTIITYHRVATDEELKQILKLQKQNLYHLISEEQKKVEGFVTLKHDFELLKNMNNACKHCVAKNDGVVVGYALSMLKSFKKDIPHLEPMFAEIDRVFQTLDRASNYMVMGQICIDKNYRGKGVFRGLYKYMASELKNKFDEIITEVNIKNIKSSQAHKAIGFEVLNRHTFNKQLWEIISLKI